jgi:hypothetical protein
MAAMKTAVFWYVKPTFTPKNIRSSTFITCNPVFCRSRMLYFVSITYMSAFLLYFYDVFFSVTNFFSIYSFVWLDFLQSRTNSPLAFTYTAHFCLNNVHIRLSSSLLNATHFIGVVSATHRKEQNLVIDFIRRQFCNWLNILKCVITADFLRPSVRTVK